MSFDFPPNPVAGSYYISGGIWWAWNGFGWEQFGLGTLTELIPAAMVSGDPPAPMTVHGTGFRDGSKIFFDGVALPTTYVSATELTTTVDPNRPVGVVPVTVDFTASQLPFTISAQAVASLTSMTPTRGMQGGSYPLQLTGTNFRADSEVLIDGVAKVFTFISATRIDTTIAAPPKGDAKRSSTVKVANDGAGANALTFTYDVITITRVDPNKATMNEPVPLTVTGTNFSAAEKIVFNGVALTTTLISSTELQATGTSPYFAPPSQPAPLAPCPVNVTGSVSPDLKVELSDPRAYIRSTYPDFYDDWFPVWDVEVWCWGPIGYGGAGFANSMVHVNGVPNATKYIFNVVSLEYMLEVHLDLTPYPDDCWIQLSVVNEGKHVGPDFPFEVKRIG